MRKIVVFNMLLLTGVVLGKSAVAQNFTESSDFLNANSYWAFGSHAGLAFNSGTSGAITTDMLANEGPSTISDPVTGNLLFYTNGETVWNANGAIMTNGDSLLGNSNYSYIEHQTAPLYNNSISTNQGTCIVPVIGEANKYYLFSLVGANEAYYVRAVDYSLGSLFYSVVDLNLDEGLGDIVPGKKDVVLSYDTLAEGMIAVPGDNCDIWLLVHARHQQEIRAYHITSAGIDTTPVISTIGASPMLQALEASHITLAVSPDRHRIARKGGRLVPSIIAHFDPGSGQVNNVIELPGLSWGTSNFGLCFSPDNSKLYIQSDANGLGQFDISVYDSATIVSSLISLISPFSQGHLRLYNDTIYFRNGSGINASNTSIHRINQPNLSGAVCAIQFNALQLLPGTNVRAGFGNDVVFPMPADSSYSLVLDTLICSNSEIVLNPPQMLDTIQWGDGSTDATLSVTQAGIYWVKQSNGCHYRVDTFIIKVMDLAEPVIVADGLDLRVSVAYDNYQWLLDGTAIPNATGSIYTAQASGDYQVIVGNAEGCVDTSAIYTVENVNIHGLKESTALIAVYPNPVDEVLYIQSPAPVDIQLYDIAGREVMELEHIREVSTQTLQAGVYILQIKNRKGGLLQTIKVVKR